VIVEGTQLAKEPFVARPGPAALPRRLAGVAAVLAAAVVCLGCGGAAVPDLVAPTWERAALGGAPDADFVGAIDLAAMREDPLFGPLLTELARKDDFRVLLRAAQIDFVGSGERGRMRTWIAVVHGVDGAPSRDDIGSSADDALVGPGEWIVGEGSAFARVKAAGSPRSGKMELPRRALFASTLRGRAIPHPPRATFGDTTDGLERFDLAVLGGEHLEIIVQARYADAASARHAAAVARLVLVAEAARTDALAALARALAKVDFDVSGDAVSMRVTLSDDLRDALVAFVERARR
jgi:hypothetical protein